MCRHPYAPRPVSVEPETKAEQEAREKREGDLAGIRIAGHFENPALGNFDAGHLKAIHAYLFQDLPQHKLGIMRRTSRHSDRPEVPKACIFNTEAGASALNGEPRSTRRTRAPTSATPLSSQWLLLRGLSGPPFRAPVPASVVKKQPGIQTRIHPRVERPSGNRPRWRRHRNRPGRQA